jgi:hypothetical protein
MELSDLSDVQRRYVQTIFAFFHEQGKWPTYSYVERLMFKDDRGFDLRAIAKSLPNGFGNGVGYNANRDDTATLTIDAVRLCKGSDEEVFDFISAVRYCVEKYFQSEEEKPTVSSDELKQHFNLSDLRTRKLMKLLQAEWTLFNGGGGTDASWTFYLAPGMEGIARFNGVTTLDEYIEKRNQQRNVSSTQVSFFLGGTDFTNISQSLERAVQADPADISEVAKTQLELSNGYYRSVLQQSQQSFRSALIWAGIGTGLIIAAVVFLLIHETANLSYVSLIGGAVVDAIGGLNFYLYGQATKQLAAFQTPLDRIQRFLLANSVCENLEGEFKQSTRAQLVRLLMDLPIENDKKT